LVARQSCLKLGQGRAFDTTDVWGWLGRRTVYVLFAIHLATRRVHLVGMTEKADEAFMKQTARNDTMEDVGWLGQVGAKYLIHDRDTKFTGSWKELMKGSGVETLALPANSPGINAYAERWVRSIKVECIRRLTFLGVGGLRRALREYLEHYNGERPHQSLENAPLGPQPPAQKVGERTFSGPIRCRERCGAVLKHYYREVA
jgi:putative transposase